MTTTQTVEPTTTTTTTTTTTAPPRWRTFFRHAVEMLVAMGVGMVLLAPAWTAVLTWTGRTELLTRPDLGALIAATNMTVAMWVWMRYRGHRGARIVEMGAAMYVPFFVLIVPYWLGILPGEDIMAVGHLLMLPAMAVAMLAHRVEYSQHQQSSDAHKLIRVIGHRAPTWIALAMTVDSFWNPSVPNPWMMLLLPAAYLFFGVIRKQFRDRRVLAIQLAGLAFYLALAAVAATAEPAVAVWVVAAGWGSHAVWDLVHHRADLVAPRWWSEWCGVVDVVIAVTIVLAFLPTA